MFLQRTNCILCGEHINVFLTHCNICSQCYELLNELDDVQVRQKNLYTKLKNYVAKMQDLPFQSDSTIKEEGSEDFSTFFETNSENVESFPSCSEANIIKIDNVDLKKLPIKVIRVTSGQSEGKSLSRSSQKDSVYEFNSRSKVSSSKDTKEEQEAFEKIQSSIQMDLSKHIQEHMNKYKPSKDVLCEICGQNFKTKIGFENHMKKHGDAQDDMKILIMNKVNEDFACNICGKIFNQKVSLSRHLFIHTGETRYQCEECGKKFVHHSSFNMHRKIHAGERNFKCLDCNKGFLSKSHLKRHLRAAHSSHKEHSCQFCGKKFAENYNLMAHIKVVHKPPDELLYEYEEDRGEGEIYYTM